jgi:hydroxylaminobenzene mutase
MKNNFKTKKHAEWLLFLGILLFLFGLLIGLLIPLMTNPRMGLTAHLEGVMNGMFLIILGLIWNKLFLKDKWLTVAFGLTVYGAFANFVAVTIAAITGAGKMMPIAGGKEGTLFVEGLISFLLLSLAIAMIVVCCLVLTGLYNYMKLTPGKENT